MSPGISERTGLDPISDPGRGVIPEPATSGTGCCPGAGPFSPVGIVGDAAQRVGVDGWTSGDGLVSDRDLALARGRKLYELSDIVLMLKKRGTTLILTHYRQLLFTIKSTILQQHTRLNLTILP